MAFFQQDGTEQLADHQIICKCNNFITLLQELHSNKCCHCIPATAPEIPLILSIFQKSNPTNLFSGYLESVHFRQAQWKLIEWLHSSWLAGGGIHRAKVSVFPQYCNQLMKITYKSCQLNPTFSFYFLTLFSISPWNHKVELQEISYLNLKL